MAKQTSKDKSIRIGLIQTVKTPLGFFTLAVLVVEAILGTIANFSQGLDRTYLIVGMLILIFLLVIVVALLAFIRPEALSGQRPSVSVDSEVMLLSPLQKIAKYRELIEQETRQNLLLNFNVPARYKPEISTLNEFPFGFCYPEEWTFTRFPTQVRYGFAIDPKSEQQLGFSRNINICIDDISDNKNDRKVIYDAGLKDVLALLPNAMLIFKDDNFVFQGFSAAKWIVEWTPQTERNQTLTVYQIVVVGRESKYCYSISFTTTKEDFDRSKYLFDNIANTFRI